MEDALIVEETVIVPDVPVLEESIVISNVPIIDETVQVPAIVQEPDEVQKVIDPNWREYVENVPDYYVYAIVTEYKNINPKITLQNINWNWVATPMIGDQEVQMTLFSGYYIAYLKDYKETGVDSQGRRFWVIRFTMTEQAIAQGNYRLWFACSPTTMFNGDNMYNNSLTFLSIGDKILNKKYTITNSIIFVAYMFTNLLGIKIKGKQLYNFVKLQVSQVDGANFRGYILDDGCTLSDYSEMIYLTDGLFGMQKLPKLKFDKEGLFPYRLTCRTLEGDLKIADFSTFHFPDYGENHSGTIPQLGYYSFMLEEVIYPQEPFLGDSVYDNLNNCRRLRKLIYPPSMPYIKNAGYFLNSLPSLEELFIPEDFGSLSEDGTIFQNLSYLNLPDYIFNIPNCKLRTFIIQNSTFGSIKFSKDSTFNGSVSSPTYTNVVDMRYVVISKEGLLDIFNQLPDFTGQPTRTALFRGISCWEEITEDDIKILTDKNWIVTT